MPHLQTFARLHVAGLNDASTLRELGASLRRDGELPERNWAVDAANRDSHLVIAVECQAAAGAAEVIHPAGGAVATLIWLGVARWARRYGIGQLLVESAIEHARGDGAAVLRIGSMALSEPAIALFTGSGFVERNYDGATVVFEKSLWSERGARQTRASAPHFYGSSTSPGSAAAALMVAMATIDSRFMTTPQVERVVAAEIDHDKGAHGEVLVGMANAAAHRSFNVVVHCALPPALPQHRAVADGATSASVNPLTAEEVVGLLSRRQVPLLRAHFERLSVSNAEPDWLVVLGFDGLLFQVFEPRRPDQRNHCVTLGEMRAALAEKRATCLVVGRS